MKSEHVVPKIGMVQFDMRSPLGDHGPTFPEECAHHCFCLGTRPLPQAETVRILIDSGMSLDFSTSSAIAYSANAYAFAFASPSDDPYAMAPGTSGISAIQRPSVSRSTSKLNRTWRLLSLAGGLRFVMASTDYSTSHWDAHYPGNVETTIQDYSFPGPQIHKCVRRVVRQLCSVAVIAFVLSLAARLSAAPVAHSTISKWTVVTQPARLVNGAPVLFRVTTPKPVRTLSASWLGHEIAFSFDA